MSENKKLSITEENTVEEKVLPTATNGRDIACKKCGNSEFPQNFKFVGSIGNFIYWECRECGRWQREYKRRIYFGKTD